MREALKPYRPLSCTVQICTSLILLLMFFIAVEKGFSLWDEVEQEQIELSENADADSDKEDSLEEDSDDFIHSCALSNATMSGNTAAFWLEAYHQTHFRSDVFTPPPEA